MNKSSIELAETFTPVRTKYSVIKWDVLLPTPTSEVSSEQLQNKLAINAINIIFFIAKRLWELVKLSFGVRLQFTKKSIVYAKNNSLFLSWGG